MHFLTKYRFSIEILVAMVAIVGIFILANRAEQTPVLDTAVETVPSAPPEMTPLMAEVLEKSTGFQHLVSYSDQGFEPLALTIKKGDTVRFANNSSRDLWIASSGGDAGRLYPGRTHESCGQSGFDSCVSMQPLEFWEFTFDAVGEWSYRNNAAPESTGTIQVD